MAQWQYPMASGVPQTSNVTLPQKHLPVCVMMVLPCGARTEQPPKTTLFGGADKNPGSAWRVPRLFYKNNLAAGMRYFPQSEITLQGQRLGFNITHPEHAADALCLQPRTRDHDLGQRVAIHLRQRLR